jgi:hypothetical protein
MTTIFLTFFIMLLLVAGMAIGVILRGQPIKGSCGGIASLGMGKACDICGGEKNRCEKESDATNTESGVTKSLAYNAADK